MDVQTKLEKIAERRERIRKLLTERPETSQSWIVRNFHLTPTTVCNDIHFLRKTGELPAMDEADPVVGAHPRAVGRPPKAETYEVWQDLKYSQLCQIWTLRGMGYDTAYIATKMSLNTAVVMQALAAMRSGRVDMALVNRYLR